MPTFDSAIFAVAVAITNGAVVRADGHCVSAIDPETIGVPGDRVLFACLDPRGVPLRATELVEHAQMPWGSFEREETDDWSAFAAARAFVFEVGEDVAMVAIERSRSPGKAAA